MIESNAAVRCETEGRASAAPVRRVRRCWAPRRLGPVIGEVLRELMPPAARVYELVELSPVELATLFRLAGLSAHEQRLYRRAMRQWRAAA